MPDIYNRPEKRGLSKKEIEVIRLVHDGLKNAEIGREIGTSEHVVKNVLRGVYDKLGFSNRIEAALWYESRLRYEGLDVNSIAPTTARSS